MTMTMPHGRRKRGEFCLSKNVLPDWLFGGTCAKKTAILKLRRLDWIALKVNATAKLSLRRSLKSCNDSLNRAITKEPDICGKGIEGARMQQQQTLQRSFVCSNDLTDNILLYTTNTFNNNLYYQLRVLSLLASSTYNTQIIIIIHKIIIIIII